MCLAVKATLRVLACFVTNSSFHDILVTGMSLAMLAASSLLATRRRISKMREGMSSPRDFFAGGCCGVSPPDFSDAREELR